MKFKEMNLPNKLTTIRMICVPFLVVLFVLHMLFTKLEINVDLYLFSNEGNYLSLNQVLIASLFTFASITDFVDGYIARKNKIISDYGKLMDPLADKLLVNSSLMFMLASSMFYKGESSILLLEIIAAVFGIIVIVRDIFVDALRMQSLKKKVVVGASILGKIKTATLMPGIVCVIVGSFNMLIHIIGLSLVTIGGIVALLGGIEYFIKMRKYIGD